MGADNFKKYFTKNGKLNSYLLRDSVLSQLNMELVEYIDRNVTSDIPLKDKIFILFYNENEFCCDCKTEKLQKLGYGNNRYRCDGCSKKLALDKYKKTNIERYGSEFSSQNENIKNKVKKTNIERYGVEYTSKVSEFKKKKIQTNIARYGCENPMQNKDVLEKSKKTSNDRYGSPVFTASQEYFTNITNMSDSKLKEYNDKDIVTEKYINEFDGVVYRIAEYFGVSTTTMSRHLKKLDVDIINTYNKSHLEKVICDFLKSLGVSYEKNKRNIIPPKEIDIYIPNKKLAIEVGGAYWHSEAMKDDKYYHYNKYSRCKDKDIQLLTFWDYELENRPEQIKSYIKSKLGIFERRISARETVFKELEDKQHQFFEDNHIQGKTRIDRNFGLIYNDEIVGCVSFATHHRDNRTYTLNRLAFKSGVQIIGGVGKLLKNAMKHIDETVVTWSDNRFSTGNIYEENGFSFDYNIKPDYCYYDNRKKSILSKQSQQKKKIGCPKDMTENEFCKSLGRYRLWDCGKKRFICSKP